MITTFWSVKGGVGTTTTAAATAVSSSREHQPDPGVLLADLTGDLPAALGLPDPGAPGLSEWAANGPAVAADALVRLELAVGAGLSLLPRGTAPWSDAARVEVLAGLLAADPRTVVVDAGRIEPDSPLLPLVASAHRSLLVLRACYLGLRRASALPVRPSGVVLVRESYRAFSIGEIEGIVGVPVVAEVPLDPGFARAVDAGLLVARPPRAVAKALRAAA